MNSLDDNWQSVIDVCLTDKSVNPINILCKLMDLEFCNVKGHEHHLMVSAALLTAYFNVLKKHNSESDGKDDSTALLEALHQAESTVGFNVGGDCDYWGNCEIIKSAHVFWTVIEGPEDLTDKLVMNVANAVGSVGGPRCCKRNAYLAISKTVEFVKNYIGPEMELTDFVCKYSKQNSNCIGEDCPMNGHYIYF